MPMINIAFIDEKVSKDTKANLVKDVTEVICRCLNKTEQQVWVVLDEVNPDNWGARGKLYSDLHKNS